MNIRRMSMLKNSVGKILLVLGLFGSAGITIAAEDHHHDKGQHGGTVVSFGDSFHIEAVRSPNKITFFLVTKDGKPSTIPSHSGGNIVLIIPGKGQQKTEIPSGSPFSEASAPCEGKGTVTATIKLTVDGKPLTGKFSMKD
jgi:hypothetical protein